MRREGSKPAAVATDELWKIGYDALPDGPTSRWTMAQAINAALFEIMERHQDTVVMGEDVGMTGGVFRITEGLRDRFGAERVIDTPLSETGIAGTAVGMAIGGVRPVVEIQFDGFVYPAFDQIVSHMARFRFRTRSNVSLPIVVRWPNGGGIAPHEFHGDSPEAYFVHTPGLTVVIPSTAVDAKGLLAAAVESPDPVLFLEPKVLYRAGREDVPTGYYTLPIGRARIRRTGNDATVVTYGGMVRVAMAAAEGLAAEGVDCEVIDLRTLKPWDQETVLESVRKTGRLVLVQEPPRTAGDGRRGGGDRGGGGSLRSGGTHRPGGRVRCAMAPVRGRAPRHHHPRSGSCQRSRRLSGNDPAGASGKFRGGEHHVERHAIDHHGQFLWDLVVGGYVVVL